MRMGAVTRDNHPSGYPPADEKYRYGFTAAGSEDAHAGMMA